MLDVFNALEYGLGLGSDSHELTIWQMVLRAIVVYCIALALIRLGETRFIGENTAFDVILAIVFGSIVSRAITGQSAFFPTLAAAVTVVLIHWLFAALAFHLNWFAFLIKGRSHVLVQDGEIQWAAMRRSHIGKHDLMRALRAQGNVTTLDEVQEARLERDGSISVIQHQ